MADSGKAAPGPEAPNTSPKTKQKKAKKQLKIYKGIWAKVHKAGSSLWANLAFMLLVPLVFLLLSEWVARGTLGTTPKGYSFLSDLFAHFPSFLLAYMLLVAGYVFISQLTRRHALAVLLAGLAALLPAIVTHYKLTLRGEPFLPWDISQIGDLMGVSSNLSFDIPHTIVVSVIVLLVLVVLGCFVHLPRAADSRADWFNRGVTAGAALVCGCILMFGVFLSPTGSEAMGIVPDMWMQDRYYRSHGVITGFLTNLQVLNIQQPANYSREAVLEIAENTQTNTGAASPLYSTSFAATGQTVQQPDIIFLMGESFWDVTALPGVSYDQPILPNLTALKEEAAYGTAYTPSYGGGTCDVEFEALTGFSMEFLPSGSKPYQQYVTDDMFSLPQYLKSQGYQTLAIHGYGRRLWNRDTAYPRFGIDTFIASEDFVNPHRRRGFISDEAMVDRIITEHENRQQDGPVFIHAVTMQNHTTYSRDRYPEGELVKVTKAPAAVSDSVIGQLEDCATGIREMDAALGRLVSYLRTTSRPTILVFWGDHMNPMSNGIGLFEATGFVEPGDTSSPRLHETPLLIWSNFSNEKVELGTLSTYNLSPVMMDLFGLEKPLMFEFLTQQLPLLHGRTRGITVNADNTVGEALSEAQQAALNNYAILQYNYLFDEELLPDYLPPEDA